METELDARKPVCGMTGSFRYGHGTDPRLKTLTEQNSSILKRKTSEWMSP